MKNAVPKSKYLTDPITNENIIRQQVEVRSPAKCSTDLGSAVCDAMLYDFVVTLKHIIWSPAL
jgi:hypothetical protein